MNNLQKYVDAIDLEFELQGLFKLSDHLQFIAQVGSLSHNTHNPDPESIDDIDLFAVVIPPVRNLLGLKEWNHWNGFIGRLDVTVFSLNKYIRLLLNGNPNILCTLFLEPQFGFGYDSYHELRANRARFVSKRAFRAFHGYAMNQHRRMTRGAYQGYQGAKRKALVDEHGYDPKMAAHVVRLWRMAIEFADNGELKVYRTADANELRDIKAGKWSFDDVQKLQEDLKNQAERAEVVSTLRESPDYVWAEEFLIKNTLKGLVNE